MRISDWSSDVCSSDLHVASTSVEPRVYRPPHCGSDPPRYWKPQVSGYATRAASATHALVPPAPTARSPTAAAGNATSAPGTNPKPSRAGSASSRTATTEHPRASVSWPILVRWKASITDATTQRPTSLEAVVVLEPMANVVVKPSETRSPSSKPLPATKPYARAERLCPTRACPRAPFASKPGTNPRKAPTPPNKGPRHGGGVRWEA